MNKTYGLCFHGKVNETMAISKNDDDVYAGLPSDSEPILQEDWDNMGGDYCITIPETETVYVSDTDLDDLISIDAAAGTFDINTDWLKQDTHFTGDVVIVDDVNEDLRVAETIREQTLQIEALTDMIQEMVEKKNFNIDWDLEKRVEQKRFIKKLSE